MIILKPTLFAATLLLFSLTANSDDSVCFLNTAQPGNDAVGDPLPDGAVMRFGTTRYLHPDNYDAMTVSPDDRWVVTMGGSQLVLWDSNTGAAKWKRGGVPDLHTGYGQSVIAFTPDSKFFYTPDRNSGLVRWNVETGEKTSVNVQWPQDIARGLSRQEIRSIDVSNSGTRILVGFQLFLACLSPDFQVLWSVRNEAPKTGMVRKNFNGRNDRLWFSGHHCYSKWTSNGQQVVAVLSEAPQTIRLLDADEGNLIREIQSIANIVRFAISPDGRSILTTERDCGSRCYSLETGQRLWEFTAQPHPRSESYFTGVDISGDGMLAAVGSSIGSRNSIYLLDYHTGDEISEMTGTGWKPWAPHFTSTDEQLISCGWDRIIRRWDVQNRQQLPPPKGIRGTSSITLSHDSETIAIVDDLGYVRLIERSTGLQKFSWNPGFASEVAFGPNDNLLYVGGTDENGIRLEGWRIGEKDSFCRWVWPKGDDDHASITEIKVNAIGDRIAVAVFRQDAMYLFDPTQDGVLAKCEHKDIYSLSFSPDGRSIVTAGWDKKLMGWKTEDGKQSWSVLVPDVVKDPMPGRPRPDRRMYQVRWSPNGSQIATGDMDGYVGLWNPKTTGPPIFDREFEAGVRYTMSYSPDGQWLGVGGRGGVVTIWELESETKLRQIFDNGGYAYNVGFSADMSQMVSGTNGESYLWNTKPEDMITDLAEAWSALDDESDNNVYRAIWSMVFAGEDAVSYISNRLAKVDTVLDDVSNFTDSGDDNQVTQRLQLLRSAIAKNDGAETLRRIRRSLHALSLIDSEASRQTLEHLSVTHPDLQVRNIASSLKGVVR